MNEVELLPQERLKCSLPKNMQMIEGTVGNEEPSGDEFFSENDIQHQEELKFVDKPPDPKPGEPEVNSGRRKSKRRYRKKPKWRPYCKLSWDERRVVDERDARRANRIRAEMCAKGHTLAPCNTTQFLMDDHPLQEPDYQSHLNGHKHLENSSDGLEFYSSPEDEEEFLQKQFTETYENIHVERLNNMTQSELVLELMSLEDRVEMLQKRLQAAKEETEIADTVCDEVQKSNLLQEQVVKLAVFREEIQKLTRENEVLSRENSYLRTRQFPVEDDDEDIL